MSAAEERLRDREDGRERGADLDDEHDRVVPHVLRVELAERSGQTGDQLPRAERTLRRLLAGRAAAAVAAVSVSVDMVSEALLPGDPARERGSR